MQQENCPNWNNRKVLFPGTTCFPLSTEDLFGYQSRTDQLRVIFDGIGTPSDEEIAFFKDRNARIYLQNMTFIYLHNATDFSSKFPGTNEHGIKLLTEMLRFDVRKRITAAEAFKSPYFKNVRDEAAQTRHEKVETFEFEDIDWNIEELRGLILKEISYWNPQ